MKVSIEEAIDLLKSGQFTVHFRPEKNLPEFEQYALIYDHAAIVLEKE